MRAIILAALVVAGFALIGSSNVSAAPANGAAIGNVATENSNVTSVRHWRGRSHHRRGACHYRYQSWGRC